VFPSEKSGVSVLVELVLLVKFEEVAFAVATFEFEVVVAFTIVVAVEAAAAELVGNTASIGYGGRFSYSESCSSMASFEGYNT
jgi:hypothetical protein